MTKKFVNTKLDLDRIEIDVEFFGLSTASLTPLDRMDDLTAYMKNAIDVFVMKNSERLIREFQSGMDRGVHYRLDTNTLGTSTHSRSGGGRPARLFGSRCFLLRTQSTLRSAYLRLVRS